LINSNPQHVIEEKAPNINIITKGGTKTSVDLENANESKIYKVVSMDSKYDPLRKKRVIP
jgi:hypothetical protein